MLNEFVQSLKFPLTSKAESCYSCYLVNESTVKHKWVYIGICIYMYLHIYKYSYTHTFIKTPWAGFMLSSMSWKWKGLALSLEPWVSAPCLLYRALVTWLLSCCDRSFPSGSELTLPGVWLLLCLMHPHLESPLIGDCAPMTALQYPCVQFTLMMFPSHQEHLLGHQSFWIWNEALSPSGFLK